MLNNKVTAIILIIGNEILSGKTQDINIQFIAKWLVKKGIILKEVRIIPDQTEIIVSTVRQLKSSCNYLFTTGGIGPTHDDITSEAISIAVNQKYQLNQEAKAILERYYSNINIELNESRLKMAFMPEGSKLIKNEISGAPGFIIENIYVLAGVPKIMQNMIDNLDKEIVGNDEILSREISVLIPEGEIAKEYANLQKKFPDIEMGSYPFTKDNKWGTNLVLRSSDKEKLRTAEQELNEIIKLKI